MARHDWRDHVGHKIDHNECAWRLYDSAKNKAKSRGLEFTLRFNDVLNRVKLGKCEATGIPFDMREKPYYGTDLPFRASLDRRDNTKGYHADNIRVVCKIYNHSKWTWNEADVHRMARELIQKEV
jgi:hypothetical protein